MRRAGDLVRTLRKAWAKPADGDPRVLSAYARLRRRQSLRDQPVTIPAASEPLTWEEALSQSQASR